MENRKTSSPRQLLAGAMTLSALATPSLVYAEDSPPPPPAPPPTMHEMWTVIQRQQREIDVLRERLRETTSQIQNTDAQGGPGEAGEAGEMGSGGEAGEAGTTDNWWQRTSVHGYGELHYNGGDQDEVDFHRAVIGVQHRFTDQLKAEAELEIEHSVSGDGEPGEVLLEEAKIEYQHADWLEASAGLFYVPLGILNPRHKPADYFGVERNTVERDIIPTTWSEAGVLLGGDIGAGFGYRVAAHSGLDVPIAGANAFKPRNGRQNAAEAEAENGALTAALLWRGLPGVELGLAGQYQSDITQGALGIDATLFSAHADILYQGFGLRGLYARWDLNQVPGGPQTIGRDLQYGWYLEPSYRFDTGIGQFGLFARYSERDNEAGDGTDSTILQFDVGTNYWPHPQVVIKADYQWETRPAASGRDDDRVNLGIGYQF